MTEFSILGEEGGQKNQHHGIPEGRLWPVQDTG